MFQSLLGICLDFNMRLEVAANFEIVSIPIRDLFRFQHGQA